MSDIFNSASNRTKILSILNKQTGIEGPMESVLIPPFQSQPKDLKGPTQMATLCKELGVGIVRAKAIPVLAAVETKKFVTAGARTVVGSKDEFGNEIIKVLSEIPYDSDKGFFPKYYPVHKTLNYNMKVLKQIIYQVLQDPNPAFGHIIKDSVHIASTKAVSSGTYIGQIHRLAKVTRVATGKGEFKPSKSFKLTMEERMKQHNLHGTSIPIYADPAVLPIERCARVFEKYLPLNNASFCIDQYGHSFPELNRLPSSYVKLIYKDGEIDNENSFDHLPSFDRKKASGLPWGSPKTKGDELGGALIICDALMKSVGETITNSYSETSDTISIKKITESSVGITRFLKDNWYLACGLLFPKQECYDTEDLLKKTRNIYAAPFPTHILAAMIDEPCIKYSYNAVNGDTPSLYKFSPFHGNLDKLVQNMFDAEQKQEHLSYVYADNWYIMYREENGTYTWFSYDLVTGEAQTTREDIQCLAYYFLTRGHVTQDGRPQFNMSWCFMAMQILPNLMADSTGLLMDLLLSIPGLGSGSRWTFYANHWKTASCDFVWREIGCPRPGSPKFEIITGVHPGQLSINWKLELEVPDFLSKIRALIQETPQDGFCQMNNTNGPSDSPVPSVDADLLGWNIAYSHQLKQFIPVLEYNRMMKSIICMKQDDRSFTKQGMKLLHTISWAYSMILVGGWCHKPVYEALLMQVQDAISTLMKYTPIENITTDLEESLKHTEMSMPLLDVLDEVSGLLKSFKYVDNKFYPPTDDILVKVNTEKQLIDPTAIAASAQGYGQKITEAIETKRGIWYYMRNALTPEFNTWTSSFSLATSMALDQWWSLRGFINGTENMTIGQKEEFMNSPEFRRGKMELDLLRSNTMQFIDFSVGNKKERDIEKAVNPRVAFKLNPEMKFSDIHKKTGVGPRKPVITAPEDDGSIPQPKPRKLQGQYTKSMKAMVHKLGAQFWFSSIIKDMYDGVWDFINEEPFVQFKPLFDELKVRPKTDSLWKEFLVTAKVASDNKLRILFGLKPEEETKLKAIATSIANNRPIDADTASTMSKDDLEAAAALTRAKERESAARQKRSNTPKADFILFEDLKKMTTPQLEDYLEKLKIDGGPWTVQQIAAVKATKLKRDIKMLDRSNYDNLSIDDLGEINKFYMRIQEVSFTLGLKQTAEMKALVSAAIAHVDFD